MRPRATSSRINSAVKVLALGDIFHLGRDRSGPSAFDLGCHWRRPPCSKKSERAAEPKLKQDKRFGPVSVILSARERLSNVRRVGRRKAVAATVATAIRSAAGEKRADLAGGLAPRFRAAGRGKRPQAGRLSKEVPPAVALPASRSPASHFSTSQRPATKNPLCRTRRLRKRHRAGTLVRPAPPVLLRTPGKFGKKSKSSPAVHRPDDNSIPQRASSHNAVVSLGGGTSSLIRRGCLGLARL